MVKNEMSINKPRELVFISVPKDITLSNKEKLIYNFILFKLQEEKKMIMKEKNMIEGLGIEYIGYVLKLSIKEIKQKLKINNNKDIVEMINNLRKVDLKSRKETRFNIGRLGKSTYYDNLIGWMEINDDKENEYFKLSISKNIIKKVVIEKMDDYVKLIFKDMIDFKSKHTLTMFEILKSSYNERWSNNKPLKMSLEEFKEIFSLNDKYTISNLKKRVLDVAKKEIEYKTDYSFDYEFQTGEIGKNYRFIEFTFNIKNQAKREAYILNKKVKNLKDDEYKTLLKNKYETTQTEEVEIKNYNDFDDEIRELENQIEMLKRKNNMLEDDADRLSQELDEKNVGLPF